MKIEDVIAAYDALDILSEDLVNLFNNHTGLYDGDDLFATATSAICKHWVPRAPEVTEDLFMNYNCNHPNGDKDWFDTDHCSIMTCPDEKSKLEIAGVITALHTKLHSLHEIIVGELFNESGLKKDCKHYYSTGPNTNCVHKDNKLKHCCIASCPLSKRRKKYD